MGSGYTLRKLLPTARKCKTVSSSKFLPLEYPESNPTCKSNSRNRGIIEPRDTQSESMERMLYLKVKEVG